MVSICASQSIFWFTFLSQHYVCNNNYVHMSIISYQWTHYLFFILYPSNIAIYPMLSMQYSYQFISNIIPSSFNRLSHVNFLIKAFSSFVSMTALIISAVFPYRKPTVWKGE